MKHTNRILTTILTLLLIMQCSLSAQTNATYDEPYRLQFHFTPPYGWQNYPV